MIAKQPESKTTETFAALIDRMLLYIPF